MGLSEDGTSGAPVPVDGPYLIGGSNRLSGVYIPGAAVSKGVEQGSGAMHEKPTE